MLSINKLFIDRDFIFPCAFLNSTTSSISFSRYWVWLCKMYVQRKTFYLLHLSHQLVIVSYQKGGQQGPLPDARSCLHATLNFLHSEMISFCFKLMSRFKWWSFKWLLAGPAALFVEPSAEWKCRSLCLKRRGSAIKGTKIKSFL